MEHIIEGARQKYKELKQIDEQAFSPKPQFKVKRRVSVVNMEYLAGPIFITFH